MPESEAQLCAVNIIVYVADVDATRWKFLSVQLSSVQFGVADVDRNSLEIPLSSVQLSSVLPI